MQSSSKIDCRICANSIPERASKCTHCGSFQGRFASIFNLGVPMTALLVALVTVASQSIPIVAAALRPSSDLLRVRLLATEPGEHQLILFVTNSGTRAGALRQATLRIPTEAVPLEGRHVISLGLNAGTRLIAPGDSIEVILTAPANAVPQAPIATERPLEYHVDLELVRFDGTLRTVSVPFQGRR